MLVQVYRLAAVHDTYKFIQNGVKIVKFVLEPGARSFL